MLTDVGSLCSASFIYPSVWFLCGTGVVLHSHQITSLRNRIIMFTYLFGVFRCLFGRYKVSSCVASYQVAFGCLLNKQEYVDLSFTQLLLVSLTHPFQHNRREIILMQLWDFLLDCPKAYEGKWKSRKKDMQQHAIPVLTPIFLFIRKTQSHVRPIWFLFIV